MMDFFFFNFREELNVIFFDILYSDKLITKLCGRETVPIRLHIHYHLRLLL